MPIYRRRRRWRYGSRWNHTSSVTPRGTSSSSFDQAVVEKQSEKLAKVLDVYEARLGENKYLAGGEFTLVDLNHLPCMYLLLKTSKADLITARPHVDAWFEDISSRPAWKKTAAGIPL